MKPYRYLLAALLSAAVSCSGDPAAESEKAIERIPDAISVRAHSELLWNNTDAVSVFDTDCKRVNFSTSHDNVPAATFSSSSWTGKAPTYAAFCCRKNETACTPEGVISVFIKGTQAATKKETCSKDGEASVGKVTGSPGSYEVRMKNISCFISVSINAGIVAKIGVSAIGGEPLSGYVDVDYEALLAGGDFWSPTDSKSMNTSVSLVPSAGGCFAPGKYLISILPGVYSKGLNVVAYDDGGRTLKKVTVAASEGITLLRNDVVAAEIILDTTSGYSDVDIEGATFGDEVKFD